MQRELISTGERIQLINTNRKSINRAILKYGHKACRNLCVPKGKFMEAEYGHYMLASGAIQLIRKSNTKTIPA